jgi:hypothetical protein
VLSRRRGAIAIAAGAALVLAAGDGLARDKAKKKGARKGKVVRVERSRLEGRLPTFCGNPRVDGGATCWGRPPEVGDLGAVLDDSGLRATVRVTAVKATLDACGNTASWELSSEVRSGDLTQLNTGIGAMVFDWKTTSRSKAMNIYGNPPVVAPGHHKDEYVLGAVDDDADNRAELILAWFYCDASGNSTQYGQGGHYCVVHYARDGGLYKELRLDVVKNC